MKYKEEATKPYVALFGLEIFTVVGGSSVNGDGGVSMCIHVCAGTCGTSDQLWVSFITCHSSSFLRAVLFLSRCLLIKLSWLASEPRIFSSSPVLSFQGYSPHPAFFMSVLEFKVRTWLYFLPYFLGKHFADQAVSEPQIWLCSMCIPHSPGLR